MYYIIIAQYPTAHVKFFAGWADQVPLTDRTGWRHGRVALALGSAIASSSTKYYKTVSLSLK